MGTPSRRRASWFLLVFTALLVVVLATLLTRAQQQSNAFAEHARLVEAKSTIILDTAPVAMIMSDTDGLVTYFNPQAEHLFGWTAEEMLGEPVYRFLTQESAKEHNLRFDLAVKRIQAREGAWQFTRRVSGHAVTKHGEEIHVNVVVRAIKYNGYIEFVAVVYPVSCPTEDKVEMRPFAPRKVGDPPAFQQRILEEH